MLCETFLPNQVNLWKPAGISNKEQSPYGKPRDFDRRTRGRVTGFEVNIRYFKRNQAELNLEWLSVQDKFVAVGRAFVDDGLFFHVFDVIAGHSIFDVHGLHNRLG